MSGRPQDGERSAGRDRARVAARLVLQDSLTGRRAAGIIAAATALITLAGGVLARIVDPDEFPTIGKGLWFSLQTVSTVGYGDVTPEQTKGRVIAAVVMLAGIGFIAVITAAVTASLVESNRRRRSAASDFDGRRELEEISSRLAAIEARLDVQASGGTRSDVKSSASPKRGVGQPPASRSS